MIEFMTSLQGCVCLENVMLRRRFPWGDVERNRAGWAEKNPGGAERNRTADLLIANEALYQLSYGPQEGAELGVRRISVKPLKGSGACAALSGGRPRG
jgi:hypothetical protein